MIDYLSRLKITYRTHRRTSDFMKFIQRTEQMTSEERETLRRAVLRTAENARAPEGFDLRRMVREADEAYWAAKTAALTVDSELEAAVASRDLAVSNIMVDAAIHGLRAERERGVLYDVVSGGILPALVVGVGYVIANEAGLLYGKLWLIVSCIALGIWAAWSLIETFHETSVTFEPRQRTIKFMRLGPAMTRYAVQSAGAMILGLIFCVVGGFYIVSEITARTEASLAKVNEGAAISIAAAREAIPVQATQAVVSTVTGADWIKVGHANGPDSKPTVIAQATLPVGRSTALVERVTDSQPSRVGSGSYLLILKTPTGSETYADYLVGKVSSSNAGQVTLKLDSGELRTVELPAGTLPPPYSAEVVAAINTRTGKTSFIQAIEGVRQRLALAAKADRGPGIEGQASQQTR
jgi:hypothetical protein